jgi:hypothetical protein
MSYINQPSIKIADGPNVDAFQRLRVSQVTTLFDSKFLHDTGSINWYSQTTGNATASYWTSSILLFASGSNTSVIRQSRRRFNYQSGKSQLIIFTGNFVSTDSNTIKRMGHFDQSNGAYFVYSGSQFGVGLRNSGQDTFISQSSWNLDTYNGLGPSGNTLNITASQIYFVDFEWLGVGRIRYGIYQGGVPTYVHQITNINALPYNNPVYKATPNNPVRYELINSGSSTSSMVQICSTVISEGGIDLTGPTYAVDTLNTVVNVYSGSEVSVLSLQYQPNLYYETVIPKHLAVQCNNAASLLKWALLLNPTISGAPLTYSAVPNSVLQYATGSPTNVITNEGTKIASGILNTYTTDLPFFYDPSVSLGANIAGTTDTLVLAVGNYSTVAAAVPTASILASMTWQETI